MYKTGDVQNMESEQEKDIKKIISTKEMEEFERAGFAQMLHFGGQDNYLANYDNGTYVLRTSIHKEKYYERLK